jgi:hypothetical protein
MAQRARRKESSLEWLLPLGKIWQRQLANWENLLSVSCRSDVLVISKIPNRMSIVAKRKTLFDDRPVEISVSDSFEYV